MKYLNTVFLAIFAILIGCSTPRPEGETEAEVVFKEAQSLVEEGRYLLATEKLNTLRSKYPYSFYATHAELLLADVQFKQENYTEAAASYILFRDFHPKHEKSDYVLWKIAESFYNQLPETFDRDLSSANEAIKYYKELVRVFPRSEYIQNSNEKIEKCKQMLHDKEQYIADFYYKTEEWGAARYRYLDILNTFRDPKIVEHAAVRVLQTSAKLTDKNGCGNYYKIYQSRLDESGRERLSKAYQACSEL